MVAVAVVGLYFGNVMIGRETAISHKIRESVFNFWELAALPIYCFSICRRYNGFGKDHLTLAMIVFVFCSGSDSEGYLCLSNIGRNKPFHKRQDSSILEAYVVVGGMREAVSVAVIPSLPENGIKTYFETITFGVVLSSLIIQYIELTSYVKIHLRQDALEERLSKVIQNS